MTLFENLKSPLLTQPSGPDYADGENFFSVPAYLTVSGQLHLEVVSGWGKLQKIDKLQEKSTYFTLLSDNYWMLSA